MMAGFLFLFTSLPIFIILAETLVARVHYDQYLTLEIHSTLFAIELKFDDHNKTKKRKNKTRASNLRRLVFKILHHSNAKINTLSVCYSARNIRKAALLNGLYYALTSSIIAYLTGLFKNFEIDNIIIEHSEHNNSRFMLDARIEIPLLTFISCLISHRLAIVSASIKKRLGGST